MDEWGNAVVRIVQSMVDAYALIERVGNGQASANERGRLYDAFVTLGMTDKTEQNSNNEKSRALLLSIIDAQVESGLDSAAELTSLVSAWKSWLALNGHRGNSANKVPTPGTTFLTHDELKLLGLELNSRETGPDSMWTTINREIQSYNGDFATFYSTISSRTESLNNAWLEAQEKAVAEGKSGAAETGAQLLAAVKKIYEASEKNTASALKLSDFSAAGVSGLTGITLAGFSSFLDSSALGSAHTSTVADIQKLVNAYNFLLDTAGTAAQTSKARDFYDAIDLLLQGNRASEMDQIPYATSSVSRPPTRTPKLPLLQSMVAIRNDDEVDTYPELDAMASAAHKVLMFSMSHFNVNLPRLWDKNTMVRYDPWSKSWNQDELDQAIGKHRDYWDSNYRSLENHYDQTMKLVGIDRYGNFLGEFKSKLVEYQEKAFVLESSESDQKIYKPAAPKKDLVISDLIGPKEPPEDAIAKLQAPIPFLRDAWLSAKAAGLSFPFLENLGTDFMKALVDNETIEFMRFEPNLPNLENLKLPITADLADALSLIPGYDQLNLPVSLPVGLTGGLSLIPRIAIGADNYWLQSIRAGEDRSLSDLLLNSIYMLDKHEVDGQFIDVPELEVDLSLMASIAAILGDKNGLASIYAELFGKLNLALDVDLDADDSGKLRLYDVLESLMDMSGEGSPIAHLADKISDFIDVKGALDLELGAELGATLDLEKGDLSSLGTVAGALASAYLLASEIDDDLPTRFNLSWEPSFTVPLFSFDTAQGSAVINV
jgi:hypothetical protein